MSKQIINTNQLSLWNEVVPMSTGIARFIQPSQNVNDEGDVTSQSISMLPITAKDGLDSLKARNPGLTGTQLKELHVNQSKELKTYLTQLGASLQANADVGGAGVRFSRNRVSLVFKKLTPQVGLLSDEELAKAMNQPIEFIKANRRKAAAVIDADTGKELKPAPQNGTPELVPSKKSRKNKTVKAPEAPAPQP